MSDDEGHKRLVRDVDAGEHEIVAVALDADTVPPRVVDDRRCLASESLSLVKRQFRSAGVR
jgi:hypothetical protein